MHTTMIQLRSSSVRSIRRPTSNSATQSRNVQTPIRYTALTSAGAAIRPVNR